MKRMIAGALILGASLCPLAANAKPKAKPTHKTSKKVVAKTRVTKSGLKITDLRVGKGRIAKAGDRVSVNYRGTLTNGKMFDQSYGRAPFDFQLGAGMVIKGWDEGVAGMRVGGQRKLVIPPSIGYGAGGSPPVIPPNATLIFTVELLKVG